MKKKLSMINRIGWLLLGVIITLVGLGLAILFPEDLSNPGGFVVLIGIITTIGGFFFAEESIYETFFTYKEK